MWKKHVFHTCPVGSCSHFNFSLFQTSTRVSITVWKHRKCFIFLNYTITWLLWAFSLVVGRDLLKDIHTDGAKSTSADLFFFFHAPIKNPSIHHLNFYCIKQIDYNYFCVYSIHTRENVIYFLNINPFPPIDWPKQLVPLLFYSNVRWF